MGHIDSMNPTKLKSVEAARPTSRDATADRPEKPVHHVNPVELVSVKLQDPVGYPADVSSSSLSLSPIPMWSSDGISRPPLLFQGPSLTPSSQAPSARVPSFSLRAPRMQFDTEVRPAQEALGSAPRELNDEKDVSNQVEDEGQLSEPDMSTRDEENVHRSWAMPLPLSKKAEPHNLPRSLLEEDTNDILPAAGKSADIWTNPHDDFEESALLTTSSVATVSPTSSPEKPEQQLPGPSFHSREFHPLTNAERTPPSRCEGKVRSEGDRVPPGMSLIDRIQEDFPRTPSPVYGYFDDEHAMSRRYSIVERGVPTLQPFGVKEGVEQLCFGDYQAAPRYDSGCSSGYAFADASRVKQHGGNSQFSSGGFGHRNSVGSGAGQSTFGVLYPGAMTQGIPASYGMGMQGIPGILGPTKPGWTLNEDVYRLQPSPFGFAPADFAAALPGANLNCPRGPSFAPAYGGSSYHRIQSDDKVFRGRPPFSRIDIPVFVPSNNYGNYGARPPAPHRPKPGNGRRNEYGFFHPVAHTYPPNSLLEEFNSSPKSEKWGLSAIKGHLFMFAKDQSGSRFIQQKLEKADDQLKAEAFNEIFPNALLLMTDVFGNYVIQKFLEYGTLHQQQMLVKLMTSNMTSLALQVYGCRVIQRALEVTQVDEQLALIQQLEGHVMQCVVDQNGNHVLQKCIEAASWKKSTECDEQLGVRRRVTGEDIQFIVDSFHGSAAVLSAHSYGCRVIQRVLEHCSPDQIRPLVNEVITNCRDLVKDQFGNYVVQHVISHGEPEQRDVVMQIVFPEIARWSLHKYASNVVEACLEHATKDEISQTIDFILQCDASGSTCPLLPMMKHMYGNYVVQKLLERADSRDRQRIVCIIRHNEDYLKRFTFGKHVVSRLDREEQANNFY